MEPIKPVRPIKRNAAAGDWPGRHRRALRVLAVLAAVIGVLMNIIHESGNRNVLSMVIGTGFLLLAVLAWIAPSRVPRPPPYPERFDKRG